MRMARIIRELKQEIEREEKVASFLERRKQVMPEGSLNAFTQNNNEYYVQKVYVDGKQRTISLDIDNDAHMDVIGKLKEKRTILHGLPILEKNIKAMKRCAGALAPYHPMNYRFGEELDRRYYLNNDVCIREWMEKPECQNRSYEEKLIHKTKRGIMVRSKSEVLIADSLYDAAVPNKYETALVVGGRIVYPDFEMLHPKTLELIWWEHLGRIDDPEYAYKNFKKIDIYAANGIVLGVNLIITYETKDRPLTHDMIDSKMRQFGLIS